MRTSPLRSFFADAGATFTTRFDTEIVASVRGLQDEYRTIRDSVGVSDFSYMLAFRIPEEKAVDFLDRLVAGNVARIRFGRVLHTFLSDAEGNLLADCYIANNDDELLVLCECIADDATIRGIFDSYGAAEAGLEQINDTHALVSVDGFKAWSVVKSLFGADVLGLPYLSVERYAYEGASIRLLRAGKTSEFGYLLLVPVAVAGSFFAKLQQAVTAQGGGLCSALVHNELRLEGRFFNIFAEGGAVRNPLMLGLQWMIDFDKESFNGHTELFKKRDAGLSQKIIGIASEKGTKGLAVGTSVCDGEAVKGKIVAVCHSYVLDCDLGLALLSSDVAWSGLSFTLGGSSGQKVHSISMPPIMPKSLGVKLDEM